MWKRNGFVFMEAATDGITGSTGATGAGGDVVPPAAAAEPSLLAAAAAAAGQQPAGGTPAAGTDPLATFPDKFKVTGADGKLDLTASAAKQAAAYAELEKKLGNAAERAPATADEYKADAVLAKVKETTGQDVKLDDAQAKGFRDLAHGLGLSQTQYEGILGAYFQNVQGMVDGAFDNAMAKGKESLAKSWGPADGDAFKGNMVQAAKAFNTYAPADMRNAQVMDQIGNNPVVLQILANVGKELGEDTRQNAGGAGGLDIQALQKSEAYWNASHADHARVVAKVNEYYAKGGKNPLKAA
jgi:hypothetical protein